MGIEREQETALISALRNHQRMAAYHIDCTVDGFSDIFAAYGNRVALIEMKYGPLSARITQTFEPTQPVFFKRLQDAEFNMVYTCTWDGEMYHLFRVNNLLKDILDKKKVSMNDMDKIGKGNAIDIAIMISMEMRHG